MRFALLFLSAPIQPRESALHSPPLSFPLINSLPQLLEEAPPAPAAIAATEAEKKRKRSSHRPQSQPRPSHYLSILSPRSLPSLLTPLSTLQCCSAGGVEQLRRALRRPGRSASRRLVL
jgi:hypothetical protein